MDKKRGLKNVIVSILFKVVILITNIFVIRFLINYIGNDINGLNSLFLSIIGFLSVAELGIGSAITYCMYKPVVDGDEDKVAALYCLFKKLYIIIGAVILVIGLAVTPLLPYFINDYEIIKTKTNVYLTFIIMLASVLITYAYSAKSSLINAYKNNYVTTTVYSCGLLLQYALQIIVTVFTRSFVWYLVSRIVSVLGQWFVTEIIVRKKYGRIIKNKRKVDEETKKEVTKNVKAMFMHKLGNVLVNTADSVIISAFISAAFLGVYSNYVKIMNAMITIIGLVFTQLTSVIGHMYVENSKENVIKYFNFFHTLNFIIGIVFFLGYFAVIDNIVSICFGANLELAREVTFVITINYFIQFMRQATLLFRDATGTFYYDRWKSLLEGVLNIALSIGFVFLMGAVGVIIATIITNIFICHIVEPHVLYKFALQSKTTKYYIKNYIYIFVFAAMLVALHFCLQSYENRWIELAVNGSIALAVAVAPCVVVALIDKDFRHYFLNIFIKIKNKFKRKSSPDAPTDT